MDRNQTLTILNGATSSSYVDKRGIDVIGLVMPAAFTGTALTFYAATDTAGSSEGQITYEGTPISIAVAALDRVALDPIRLASVFYFRVESDAPEADDRIIQVIFRGF